MKQDFSGLDISINGGITTLDQSLDHLNHIHGVMIGREVYQNPYMLSEADQLIWSEQKPIITREELIDGVCDYIDMNVAN